MDGERLVALEQLRFDWANANLREDPFRSHQVVQQFFTPYTDVSLTTRKPQEIVLHLHGTNFQIKVWEAPLGLLPGTATPYEVLAEQVGSINTIRAVGNAVAHNPLAFIIPCHRVLQKAGGFGDCLCGSARKKVILGWEMTQAEK